MSDENQVDSESSNENEVDYKALYEKTKSDLDAVAAKKEELYKETKAAKAAREQAIEDGKRSLEDRAKKDGEFENLYQTKAQEVEQLKTDLQKYKQSVRYDKLQAISLRLATELADGDNAEILSEFISKKLDSLADDTANLDKDVVSDVLKEFANSQKYKSLLRRSQASGGNAQGNTSGKAETKEISRADFDKLDQTARREYIKSRGAIVD